MAWDGPLQCRAWQQVITAARSNLERDNAAHLKLWSMEAATVGTAPKEVMLFYSSLYITAGFTQSYSTYTLGHTFKTLPQSFGQILENPGNPIAWHCRGRDTNSLEYAAAKVNQTAFGGTVTYNFAMLVFG